MSKPLPLGHKEISPFKNPIDFFFKSLNIRTVSKKKKLVEAFYSYGYQAYTDTGKVLIYPKTPKIKARLQIAYNFHALKRPNDYISHCNMPGAIFSLLYLWRHVCHAASPEPIWAVGKVIYWRVV